MSDRKAGNFVCAALPSIVTHCDNALKDYPDHMNNESINKFFHSNVNKFLSSIGVVIPKLSKNPKNKEDQIKKGRMKGVVKKYLSVLDRFDSCKYLENTERIIDSAGFSIQQPEYFDRSEIPEYIDVYNNDFLKNYSDRFTYAFLLDIAPGAVCCPYTSYKDMYNLADESYKMARELPQNVRDKLIYIHHFRTPSINKIYKKLLPKYADGFKNFATGGLVSFSRTGKVPPYIMYAVPLMHIIQHAKERNLKKFRFHVLGGSEWKEIVGHKFFERHIKELFDIDVQITFDSSTLFKTLCLGRYTFQIDKDQKKISKLTLRSGNKGNHVGIPGSDRFNEKTNEEVFRDLINEAVVPSGMKALDLNEFGLYEGLEKADVGFTNEHESPKGRLSRLAYMYGMFQLLYLFKTAEDWCEEEVDRLYPYFVKYDDYSIDKINQELDNFMIMLNGGENLSDNLVKYRSLTIHNSLDLLTSLRDNPKETLEKCDWLIDEFMSGDECQQLMPYLNKENAMPGFEE